MTEFRKALANFENGDNDGSFIAKCVNNGLHKQRGSGVIQLWKHTELITVFAAG